MRILLLEDDEVLVDILLKSLTEQHYVIDAVADGQSGWEYAQTGSYELIIMDVGLPLVDGITLCRKLRSEAITTPILLMTAKDAVTDRIQGLDAGADDYLSKPVDLGELQARIRALLRRGEVTPNTILQIGPLYLDPVSCQVSYGEKPLKLTPKEYNLLELLLRNSSRVFSRSQIIDHLWSFDDPPLEDSVKAHIKGLRQKLKKAGAVGWIENVYGLGYRLNPQIQASFASQKSHPESIEQQYQGAVEQMWQQYQPLMAQRLAVLQTAATAVHQNSFTEELGNSAAHEAHKLAGVLGMFGRETGTRLAKEIENLLSHPEAAICQQLPSLVQQLDELLALSEAEIDTETSPSPDKARLLLIDSDYQLGAQLQQLAKSARTQWYQVDKLPSAQEWLTTHSPDVVVLCLEQSSKCEEKLALVSNLAALTPPIPVLVLATKDVLDYRVNAARAGANGFLVKPINAAQIWSLVSQLSEHQRTLAINVLVVDDDPMILSALPPLLEPWGIRMTGLADSQKFWHTLQSVRPDLLILDVEMPQLGGIELCQAVRTDPYWQSLPILFLTAHRDAQTVQEVFAAGADDYVTKPIVGAELITRISNRLERARLLKTLSNQDPQTGTNNYRQSSHELTSLSQNSSQFCLAILRIPRLSELNREHTHTFGHQILQRWGRLLKTFFRGAEVLGYWGNGEFIVGLPGLHKGQASDRILEVLATLRKQKFSTPDGVTLTIPCDWAIAEYPTAGKTIQALYQQASREIGNE